MAKEVKKGNKKVAVAKKAPAKKVVKPVAKKVRPVKKTNKTALIAYMFLLILGFLLAFVSLILKTANYIDTRAMITSFGIALVALILSAFIKKMNE